MPTNALALSRLLVAERPGLVRRLAGIVGSESLAEDVTQSLYLRLQRLKDDPPILHQRSFLFRLASNLAVDYVRAEQSQARRNAEAHALLWAEPEALDPERTTASCLELERVLKAASSLPEPTRSIFRLHRFEGLRQSEVAACYGVSVTTVEKHVRRALAVLRKARDEG
jgi:RNA polymerase sigma-70 factor (ECF subfamily)